MKKKARNLTAGIMAGALSVLPVKNANAERVKIDGWLEASLGKPTANLRLYPRISAGNINLQSLIDINGYYSFNKTDLSHGKLKTKFLGTTIKPVVTLFTDSYKKRVRPGINISYSKGPFFGFFEVGAEVSNIKHSTYCTYNNLALPRGIGNIGVFMTGELTDILSSYMELEATGPGYKGIAPYARVNLQKGTKPGLQAGISITPKKFFNRGSKGGK